MLSELNKRAVDANKFTFKVTDNAKTVLIEEGYNPAYGARPLRRAIMKLLEDQLATKFLNGSIPPGSTVVIDASYDQKLAKEVIILRIDEWTFT